MNSTIIEITWVFSRWSFPSEHLTIHRRRRTFVIVLETSWTMNNVGCRRIVTVYAKYSAGGNQIWSISESRRTYGVSNVLTVFVQKCRLEIWFTREKEKQFPTFDFRKTRNIGVINIDSKRKINMQCKNTKYCKMFIPWIKLRAIELNSFFKYHRKIQHTVLWEQKKTKLWSNTTPCCLQFV